MKRLNVDLPGKLHFQFKLRCIKHATSVSDVVRNLIDQWLRLTENLPNGHVALSGRKREASVYLFRHTNGKCFKIGRSISPLSRSEQVPQDIDLATSVQIAVPRGEAARIETLLLRRFDPFRVYQPYSSGYTEWFDIGAWDAVLAFMEERAATLDLGEPEVIDYSAKLALSSFQLWAMVDHSRVKSVVASRLRAFAEANGTVADVLAPDAIICLAEEIALLLIIPDEFDQTGRDQ